MVVTDQRVVVYEHLVKLHYVRLTLAEFVTRSVATDHNVFARVQLAEVTEYPSRSPGVSPPCELAESGCWRSPQAAWDSDTGAGAAGDF